jgi:hypothetical protein
VKARTEAFGWACIYGIAGGLCASAAQEASWAGQRLWQYGFAGYTVLLVVVFFAVQWRELRG